MKADIRVIRLMRKIIRDKDDKSAENPGKQINYFATDYFDEMKVEEKNLFDSFTSIMGIWPDEKMDISDVAAQSYSLYCNEKMMELEKECEKCGDPFSNSEKTMPFLSMTQVHIAPDVMAHAFTEKSAADVMNAFYEDIHAIMKTFVTQYENVVFRIYKMLSAGDFAIVLRSDKVEAAFKVSSLLRKRGEAGTEKNRLMFYKTYTLLTFENEIIMNENESDSSGILSQEDTTQGNCFVIRGCYSNLYWKDENKIQEYLKSKSDFYGLQLHSLTGRYDFSVRITGKQFLKLLGDIKEYKKRKIIVSSISDNTEEDSIVKYMRYLMKNRYLSYINERYLFAQNVCEENQMTCYANEGRERICTSSIKSREEFLDCKINKIYDSIADKYCDVRRKVNQIITYRKNMKHYMNLLDKLIKLCYGINGFSDTRIYAAVLLEQLEVVIDSIEIFVEMYLGDEKDENILYYLEEHIREAVCALDGYAQYIRNNNLQSLQTPNYNIESNTSMEKLLIGYSEFLKIFTDFYVEFYMKRIEKTKKKDLGTYLPIVIPRLSRGDVSVEILFPKGILNDWDKEMEIRNNLCKAEGNRYCMVISVPTLTELGNVRTMVTSLFHEVAHQFRYESRKERNDALLKYLVHITMRDITRKLIETLQNVTGLRDYYFSFNNILINELTESYLNVNYMTETGELQYHFQDSPLNVFENHFEYEMIKIFEYIDKKDDMKSAMHIFLNKVLKYCRLEMGRYSDALNLLNDLIIQDIKKDADEFQCDKIVKCAYGISWECACQVINDGTGSAWGSMDFKEWMEQSEKFDFKEQWDNVFGEKESIVTEIWDNFYCFSCWIYDSYHDYLSDNYYYRKKYTQFLKKAYKRICIIWNEENMQKRLIDDFDSVFSFMGKALGIDCNTDENYKHFEQLLTYVINQSYMNISQMVKWRIKKYREETADMFMCNAMNLTPFGYLHMLAVSWPSDDEMSSEYFNRSLDIILFQWCLEENELSHAKFRTLCVGIIKKLNKEIRKTADRICRNPYGKSISLMHIEHIDEWSNNSYGELDNLLDVVDQLAEFCEDAVKQAVSVENSLTESEHDSDAFSAVKDEYDSLKFYRIMANMMEQLMVQGEEQIDFLNDFSELRDDYIRGVRKLEDLNNEMRKDDNLSVRQLGDFCKEVGSLQNEPYLLLEDNKNKETLNERSIDFLLNMYYTNKRHFAQKTGGITCHL